MTSNQAELERWNDSFWTTIWPKREQLTSSVTGYVLEHLDPVAGARVLDIGSGGGMLTLAIAGRVEGGPGGPGGRVVGADISEPLTRLAQARAGQAGVTNASFVVADVQESTVAGAPFDAAVSQFGVMFFDEPVRAFTNIRSHLQPGRGRLVFACWQAAERNQWNTGATLASFAEPPPALAPGKSPTGPFALSDPDATAGLLQAAGWVHVARHLYDLVVVVDRDAVFDEGELRFRKIPESNWDAARRAVDDQLRPLARPDGRLDASLAFQVFTAQA